MNIGGDATDQMVRMGIMISEEAIKLAALGSKNLAALLLALARENRMRPGKSTLKRLMRESNDRQVIPMDKRQLRQFSRTAPQYGILYHPIPKQKNMWDVLVQTNQLQEVNHVLQAIEYNTPPKQILSGRKRRETMMEQLEKTGPEVLAALILALSQKGKKSRSLRELEKALAHGQEPKMYTIPGSRYEEFCRDAQVYDLSVVPIQDTDGNYTLAAPPEPANIAKLERTLERLDVQARPTRPQTKENTPVSIKKPEDRASVKDTMEHCKALAAMRAANSKMRARPAVERQV